MDLFMVSLLVFLMLTSILFDPYFDISETQIILWYNKPFSKERKHKIIWTKQ